MYDLSIIIPSRHEEFLNKTIEDILAHKEGNTQIIVGLDGEWPMEPIKTHPDVIVLHYPESIGQRAISNRCVSLSSVKYIMKVDAHCAFDQGFDVKLMSVMKDDWTLIPTMRNLHVFDWVCPEGHRRYQGPSGKCEKCGKDTTKDVVWIAKNRPQSNAYRFDRTMHFQYWNEFARKQNGDLTETMSIQGSCFMVTRDKWWELDLSSEQFNSWGQQGVEVACKTWLSGGKVMVYRKTWYAHMFRTQGGDFSFPYQNPESKIQENRELSKQLFEHDGWDKAIHPFQWLIDKFNPPEWKPTKGILYYTDNKLNMKLAHTVRKYIAKAGLPITSVTLKPTNFGKNIVLKEKRGVLTMFKQILKGLENMKEDIVFFCEHDVLYPKEHFDFIPPKKDVYYYDKNVWRINSKTGQTIYYDHKSAHALCAWRETLLKEYKERVNVTSKLIFGNNFTKGYEPGTRSLRWGGFSDSSSEYYESKVPLIDIRHMSNLSASKWKPEQFKSQRSCQNWKNGVNWEIPGWGNIKEAIC
jgi:hypothetical protein